MCAIRRILQVVELGPPHRLEVLMIHRLFRGQSFLHPKSAFMQFYVGGHVVRT
jgi:hypothetical protein